MFHLGAESASDRLGGPLPAFSCQHRRKAPGMRHGRETSGSGWDAEPYTVAAIGRDLARNQVCGMICQTVCAA